MALSIILRVGDTSAQDISLTSSGVFVMDTAWMNTPDLNQQTLETLEDGNSLGVPSWTNVTESLELHISDTTAALVAAKVQSIERLLDLARQGTTGYLDDKLYLLIKFDQDAEWWRSQIIAAKLETAEASNQIWKNYTRATLIITRRYYYEAVTLQSVAISSGVTTTPTTGYATVYNADNAHATNRNWFQVASTQVTGAIPAPAKISIKNISGGALAVGTVYLGNYVWNDPTTVQPIFRNAVKDGGDSTPSTTEGAAGFWNLSDGNLVDAFRGQFGRFVVVWSDRPAVTTLLRAAVQYRFPAPTFDLALGEQMLNDTQDYVQDLGALPIPPARYVNGQGPNLYVAVNAKAASGTDTLGINWLQIFPTGKGRYRVLKGITSYSIAANEEVVDDGPAETSYALSTGQAHPLFRPLFTPIYLWPNKTQRIRMLISAGPSAFEDDTAWGCKCEVRPRRLSF